MNYPGNLKKNYNKEVSYGNRGMDLESIINETNKYYLDNDIAIIYKKPTPIGIVKVDYNNRKKIVDAYFKEPSTLDYNGIFKGKYIEFDAKETKSKTSFPLNNIHEHQLKHMINIINHGGICFLIININNEYYYLKAQTIIDFYEKENRKSIPYIFIKEKGFIIKYNYIKGLDYIKIIDNYLEDKNEKN